MAFIVEGSSSSTSDMLTLSHARLTVLLFCKNDSFAILEICVSAVLPAISTNRRVCYDAIKNDEFCRVMTPDLRSCTRAEATISASHNLATSKASAVNFYTPSSRLCMLQNNMVMPPPSRLDIFVQNMVAMLEIATSEMARI